MNTRKVALLGNASVGKSCIMERACHNRFIEGYESTVGLEFGKLELMSNDGEKISIQIWDTAGQERFRSLIANYYRDAHGILLIFDLTNEKSFNELDYWIGQIQEKIEDQSFVLAIVGNKIDLIEDTEAELQPLMDRGNALARKYNGIFYTVSAKTGQSIMEVFVEVAKTIAEKQ